MTFPNASPTDADANPASPPPEGSPQGPPEGGTVDDAGQPVAADIEGADHAQAGPPARKLPASVARRHVPRGGESWFRRTLEKLDSKLSRLSTKNNFWHRCFSWIFLPLAYRSGIRIKHVTGGNFSVVLPFRRFNKNWYSAMAGAALLGNTEVAGGMFVFNKCGGDFTVVCKNMNYRFLRPCYGPAIYNIEPREDLDAQVAAGEEFNITLDINIMQAVHKRDKKERRVGKAEITFHATPKQQARARMQRRLERLRDTAKDPG